MFSIISIKFAFSKTVVKKPVSLHSEKTVNEKILPTNCPCSEYSSPQNPSPQNCANYIKELKNKEGGGKLKYADHTRTTVPKSWEGVAVFSKQRNKTKQRNKIKTKQRNKTKQKKQNKTKKQNKNKETKQKKQNALNTG